MSYYLCPILLIQIKFMSHIYLEKSIQFLFLDVSAGIFYNPCLNNRSVHQHVICWLLPNFIVAWYTTLSIEELTLRGKIFNKIPKLSIWENTTDRTHYCCNVVRHYLVLLLKYRFIKHKANIARYSVRIIIIVRK